MAWWLPWAREFAALAAHPRGDRRRVDGFGSPSAAADARDCARAPITGAAPVAVSLTSYGKRLEIVGHAIESIARGPVRPRRMILWVSDDGFDLAAYPRLARLEKRGLEILRSADFGPHKKSHPYVEAYAADGLDLVTADDDIMYPQGWLAGLIAARRAHPGEFVGYRAKRVVLDAAGDLAPYAEWPGADVGESGPRVFLHRWRGRCVPATPHCADARGGGLLHRDLPARGRHLDQRPGTPRRRDVTRRVPCRGFALSFPRSPRGGRAPYGQYRARRQRSGVGRDLDAR
jgi:hypothetical protein